jgi:hypothetical protein
LSTGVDEISTKTKSIGECVLASDKIRGDGLDFSTLVFTQLKRYNYANVCTNGSNEMPERKGRTAGRGRGRLPEKTGKPAALDFSDDAWCVPPCRGFFVRRK